MRHNQNRRSRGRGRKGPNPLTRSYESNGPDVKVRGTAAHVAEKYASLARDALSAGDTVSAEAYFQHAEHYNRIVAAAQAQAQPPAQQPASRGGDDDARRDFNGGGDTGSDDNENAAVKADRPPDPEVQKPTEAAAGNGSADEQPQSDGDGQSGDGRKPNGRRPRRKKADIVAATPAESAEPAKPDPKAKAAEGDDKTQDGAAALAAFPD